MEIFDAPSDYGLPKYFGMTTRAEQAYCWHFAKERYAGVGEWIELGTFLGALTFPAVEGLRCNPSAVAREKKIQVFDLFRFSPVMVDCIRGTEFEERFSAGEWYRPKYLEIVEPILDHLDVHPADLTQYLYTGPPIEFLLLDVLKYERLVRNVTTSFFPHLLPGRARILQQDYLHFYEGWSTLQMYALRHVLEPETIVQGSGSVVFRLTGEPSPLPDFPLDSKELDEAWCTEAFAWSRAILPSDVHPFVAATEMMMALHRRDMRAAARHDREISSRGWDAHSEVRRMREFVRARYPGFLSSASTAE